MTARRVALIGCGGMGSLHAGTLHRHGVRLLCCDPIPERATALAADVGASAHADLDEVLEARPDAAVVTTPTSTHPEVVRRLILAGVPTFCEKPLAMTLADTESLGRLADAQDVVVQVGFHRRFDPGYEAVRARISRGDAGRVNLIRAGTHEEPERAVPVSASGTVLRDLLIHDFDAVRFVTGTDVVAVTTAGVEGHSGVGVGQDWPAAAAILEMADGALAVVTGGRPDPPGYDARIEVHGSHGAFAAGLDARTPLHAGGPGAPRPYVHFRDRFPQAYANEIMAFLGLVDGGENRCPWVDAYEALRISVAAEQSLLERRRVAL
jgi:myo-inositol 2-dehydrogenase/D-chiro-inositol 1-dehydrogenase